MKKIFKIFLLLIALSFNSNAFADEEINSATKKWFTNYAKNISAKNTDQKEILYFEGFANNLNELIAKKKLSEAQINLINDLIKLSNEHIFNIELKQNESESKSVLDNNPLLSEFKYKSYNSENIFLENGIWYTYNYDKHLIFPKGITLSKKDLNFNHIDTETSIAFLEKDGTLGFLVDFQKVKLITDDIIYGVADKYDFLREIKNDKKKLNTETDVGFLMLKSKVLKLTEGKTKSDKIKTIYSYLLENIKINNSTNIKDYLNYVSNNPEINSGINTFLRQEGEVLGQNKLFFYMLCFANINDSQVITGYLLDSIYFPNAGFSWMKIGDNYYDLINEEYLGKGNIEYKKKFSHYNLPYDLFYINKYDLDELPSFLKEKDLNYRIDYIAKKLPETVEKYKNSGYLILKYYLLKYGDSIDINDLQSIFNTYEVTDLKYNFNGEIKKIKGFNYFSLNNIKIEDLIMQLNYSLKGYTLFKWIEKDGSYEYRLGYDIIYE